MPLEFERLKESEVTIKKLHNNVIVILTKNKNLSSEQVITYVEYKNGNKYLAIAPRYLNGNFTHTHNQFLFLIKDLEKGESPYSFNSLVELVTYNPKDKKFNWESEHRDTRIEKLVLHHMKKEKPILKFIRRIIK